MATSLSRFPIKERAWYERFANIARKSCESAFDLVFPPYCVYCGDELEEKHHPHLCSSCCGALAPTLGTVCVRCAAPKPATDGGSADCPRCRDLQLQFKEALALGVYRNDLREAVLRMKRSEHHALTWAIGGLLAEQIRQQWPNHRFDIIVPVPMHWSRRLIREVNQAELLVASISRELRLQSVGRLMRYQRKVKKQGMLGPAERLRNVRGAMAISFGYQVSGARILLVDDVMTTGATANEAARVLRRAGAESICVAVVARGIGS